MPVLVFVQSLPRISLRTVIQTDLTIWKPGDAEIKQKFLRKQQTKKAVIRLPSAWNRSSNSPHYCETSSTDISESSNVAIVEKEIPRIDHSTDDSSTDNEQLEEKKSDRRGSSIDFVKKAVASKKVKRKEDKRKQRAVVAAVITLVTTSLHRG